MELGKVTQGVGGEVRLELEAPDPRAGRLLLRDISSVR